MGLFDSLFGRRGNGIVAGDNPALDQWLGNGRWPSPADQQQTDQPGLGGLFRQQTTRPVWKDVLGTALDAIAVAEGMPGNYWAGINAEKDRLAEQMAEEEKFRRQIEMRRQDRLDARNEHLWKQQNLGPTSLQRDYDFWRRQPGNDKGTIDQFMDWYRPQMFGSMGQQYQIERGGEAPDTLSPEEFMRGAPIGGGGGNATGGFRPRRR